MKHPHLSKSDFSIARSCSTKLYYLKNKYPNTIEDDEYLELMAEGGYMIGKMAQLLYPEGITITLNHGIEAAIEETKKELLKESVTLFEPVFLAGKKLVRVDVLIKNGNAVELIEVKAKSYADGETFLKKDGTIYADWQKYLEDVCFQTITVEESCPTLTVKPYLMLVNKSRQTKIDNLACQFEIKNLTTFEEEGFRSFDVIFSGDENELRANHFLEKLPVSTEVALLKAELKLVSQKMEASLGVPIIKIKPVLTKDCVKCEFWLGGDTEVDGFHECWGALAKVKPHVFDLYYAGALGGTKTPLLNELILNGKVSLYDIPDDAVKGKRGERQRIQIDYTKTNSEWIDPALKSIMEACAYPLQFIDFETSRTAVPPYKGMKPYDNIAFQWSCHTIHQAGDEPVHHEWINTDDAFPNFEFAKTLMENVGYDGTVFMWSAHENTTLKEIYNLLTVVDPSQTELIKWLDHMTKKSDDEDYTMVDLNTLTIKHFFHPMMKGRTSIKYVLPAVWSSFPKLDEVHWLRDFFKLENGERKNPYELLPPLEIGQTQQVIRDGTGAMRAYQEMMYGIHRHDKDKRAQWTALLKQYCKLDTLAMVVIWEYWRNNFKSSSID